MTDLAILFTYHRDDDATRDHHARLVSLNPGVPIVPLVDGGDAFIPGTFDVAGEPWRWGADRNPWANCDTIWYRWFLSSARVDAARYVVVEWDVLTYVPLRDFLGPVWDADLAAPMLVTPEMTPWVWWEQIPSLGPMAAHAAGALPLALSMYSRRALEVISRTRLDCFSELRVGTEARAAGLNCAEIPGARRTVVCNEAEIDWAADTGVYHPVKRCRPIDRDAGFH